MLGQKTKKTLGPILDEIWALWRVEWSTVASETTAKGEAHPGGLEAQSRE